MLGVQKTTTKTSNFKYISTEKNLISGIKTKLYTTSETKCFIYIYIYLYIYIYIYKYKYIYMYKNIHININNRWIDGQIAR
jgi:hypothetical protein